MLKPVKPSDLIDAVYKLKPRDSDEVNTDPTSMDESRSSLDAGGSSRLHPRSTPRLRGCARMYAVEARVNSSEDGSEDPPPTLDFSTTVDGAGVSRPGLQAGEGLEQGPEGMTVLWRRITR